MAFKMELRTANAAFQDGDLGYEVARILREIANKIENEGATKGRPMDYNGNTVGEWSLTEEDE